MHIYYKHKYIYIYLYIYVTYNINYILIVKLEKHWHEAVVKHFLQTFTSG